MHVVLIVERANGLACLETRAAPHANAHDFSSLIAPQDETLVRESTIIFITSDAQVYVTKRGEADVLADAANAFDRERARDFFGAHRPRRLTVSAGNIKPVMKPGIFS